MTGRKKTVSFSQERKESDSEMSTDTDGRTPDTDVTDSVSDTEEEEKSGSARRRWKIGIGKVGNCNVVDWPDAGTRNSWNSSNENENMSSL